MNKLSFSRRLGAGLLGLAAWGAQAAPVVPAGDYVLDGGGGQLRIEPRADAMRFSIDVVGGNAHTCSLSGRLVGTQGRTDDADGPDSVCRIQIQPSADGLQMTVAPVPATSEACRSYCGMRASFEGRYLKPQGVCTAAEQRRARDAFLAHYRAKRFDEAVATLAPVLAQCRPLIDWIRLDRLRNDLALAHLHAGQAGTCTTLLRQTVAAESANEAALREALPPMDFDSYLPTARATWHNLRLCAARPGARP